MDDDGSLGKRACLGSDDGERKLWFFRGAHVTSTIALEGGGLRANWSQDAGIVMLERTLDDGSRGAMGAAAVREK